MTSNIGLERFNQTAALGFESGDAKDAPQNFEAVKQHVQEEIKTAFRPELVNRIDKIIVFKPLTRASVARIAGLQLTELGKRLASEHHLTLRWDMPVVKHIATRSFSPDQGARGIRKYILDFVETPLADIILKGGKSVTTIILSLKGDKIQLLSS